MPRSLSRRRAYVGERAIDADLLDRPRIDAEPRRYLAHALRRLVQRCPNRFSRSAAIGGPTKPLSLIPCPRKPGATRSAMMERMQ
jgi:hypothetical protein